MQKKVTIKRSVIGNVYEKLMDLFNVDEKLKEASFKELQLLEDTKTPVKKGYEKEVIEDSLCWWINKEKSSNGILVYLPGGGFTMGPIKLHWKYCAKMSKELQMAVLVIRYKLAPQFPFPAALNDIATIISLLQESGILREKWFLGGDSAGGNLALATCFKLRGHLLPKKILLNDPLIDMGANPGDADILKLDQKDEMLSIEFAEKVKQAYVGNHDLKQPLLSPINGDLSILPPVLLQQGSDQILAKSSRQFAEKMQEAGKTIQYEEYEGMYHDFMLSPGLPEAKKAIKSQVAFIKNSDQDPLEKNEQK